jgi:pSer/pThr/pTyr-binding forkhead associated (FHA) protein
MLSNGSIADFLGACGADGPIEVHVENTARQEVVRHLLPQPFLVVGRDPLADLRLVDGDVSKRHAYFQVIGGSVYCIDLQSRTQLHWAHGPGRLGWLTPTQAVRVGPCKIQLTGGVPPDPLNKFHKWNPLTTFPPGQGPQPDVILESLDSSHRPVRWRMNRALVLVGQSEDCKLCIREGTVSQYCCSLVKTPAGVWVVDLLGRSGTFVNDKPVRWSYLHEGDSLRVGGVVLHVRYESNRPVTTVSPRQALGMPLGNDAAASLLGPLASQLALMQQQMFDQFMQALLAMGQMFGQLHRDQLNLIQEELTKVQQVNQNLQLLHMELARREVGRGDGANFRLGGARPELEARPPSPSASEGNGAHRSSNGEATTSANGGNQLQPPAPERPAKAHWPCDTSAQDVHAQLSQRVMALQQERESLWRQLLDRLLGRRSGEASL